MKIDQGLADVHSGAKKRKGLSLKKMHNKGKRIDDAGHVKFID